MTLYESILRQIEQNAVRLYELLDQHPPGFSAIRLLQGEERKNQIEATKAKEKPLLDAAVKMRNSSCSDAQLDEIADNVLKPEITREGYSNPRDMLLSKFQKYAAKREILKEKIRFYSQILQQEGETEDFQTAVKLQFRDRKNYKTAIEPLIQAEKDYWRIRSSYGDSLLVRIYAGEAIIKTLEESIDAIFGN